MVTVPTMTIGDGVAMPRIGFGVYRISPDQMPEALGAAFAAGYRHVDTATQYGNEEAVGKVVAASGLPREDVFVTTKVYNDAHGYDTTLRAFDASTDRLGVDRLDLYLIHWPVAPRDLYVETWRALEQLRADGRVRAIGVSNFQIPHLERLLAETGTVPAVNQIELHPWLAQRELRAFHAEHGIATVAWAPLARAGGLLAEPVIVGIAQRLGRSPAQIVLRWHLQTGHSAIPKSSDPNRIAANVDIVDFALSDDDMAALDALDSGRRIGNHPDTRT